MLSPFRSLKNCVLTFEDANGGTTTDELGNVISKTSDRIVTAYLKRASAGKQSVITRFSGVTESAIWLEGYTISPQILPVSIIQHQWARAEFGGQSGYFCLGMVNPPYGREGIGALIEASTGTKIEGWFQATPGQ